MADSKASKPKPKPRGSIYTTIRELGPKIPYYIEGIMGPSSLMVVYVDPLGNLGFGATRVLPGWRGILFFFLVVSGTVFMPHLGAWGSRIL